MQLSEDGTVLIQVQESDLENGHYIIPAGVTHIGDGAHVYIVK